MSLYLDASVLVSLFAPDTLSARADALLRSSSEAVIVSDFAMVEFASSISRRVRMGETSRAEAGMIFDALDDWCVRIVQRAETEAADMRAASGLLRRLDLSLRTGDALNIAIARRLDAALATFDNKMADCARKLGLRVLTG